LDWHARSELDSNDSEAERIMKLLLQPLISDINYNEESEEYGEELEEHV
jgi:hypothetical protein